MKVLDLQCSHQHSFEGWFASEDDFQSQLSRGMVQCPLCSDTVIVKKLSAPRLNLGHSHEVATPAKHDVMSSPGDHKLQASWLQMVRHVMANTEDVGEKFAEEARKIHYGEAKERNIRGQASREETEALIEEGIAVLPLPIPAALKEPLQ
ncbi:DUF1178 family protein [Polaromonas sp.]|uniref:DUF1178 family protein n=1 Tax=Polaromonas sp. TaxID=1869339 RepID=UPI002FCB43F7